MARLLYGLLYKLSTWRHTDIAKWWRGRYYSHLLSHAGINPYVSVGGYIGTFVQLYPWNTPITGGVPARLIRRRTTEAAAE